MEKEIKENAELMNTDSSNYVVMANELIKGKSALTLNATKILRTAIMQIKPDDEEIKPFVIAVEDFAELIGKETTDYLYNDLKRVAKELLSSVIEIEDRTAKKNKWKGLNWCSECLCENGMFYIYLNNRLKPYLIGLQKLYTQYQLDFILQFRSIYGIRLYELIKMGLQNIKIIKPHQQVDVEIMLDVIRRATDTEKTYPNISDFKKRVIVPAINDINKIPLGLIVSYDDIKKGRKVIGFTFHVTSWTAQNPLPPEKHKQIDDFKERMKEKERRKREQIKGQYDIEDYEQFYKLRGED